MFNNIFELLGSMAAIILSIGFLITLIQQIIMASKTVKSWLIPSSKIITIQLTITELILWALVALCVLALYYSQGL